MGLFRCCCCCCCFGVFFSPLKINLDSSLQLNSYRILSILLLQRMKIVTLIIWNLAKIDRRLNYMLEAQFYSAYFVFFFLLVSPVVRINICLTILPGESASWVLPVVSGLLEGYSLISTLENCETIFCSYWGQKWDCNLTTVSVSVLQILFPATF